MAKPLVLNIPDDLERRLIDEAADRGLSLTEYTLEVLQHRAPDEDRRAEAVALLQSWIDESGDESETGSDDFLKSIDEDRPAERKLFPPELKGISW